MSRAHEPVPALPRPSATRLPEAGRREASARPHPAMLRVQGPARAADQEVAAPAASAPAAPVAAPAASPAAHPAAPPQAPAAQATPPAAPSAALRVALGAVRAFNTPQGMPDRIPPRVSTTVPVVVQGLGSSEPDVMVFASGAGGAAKVNGGNWTTVRDGVTMLDVEGTAQTPPGGARLELVASQRGKGIIARSAPFAVAAIPQNWSITLLDTLNDHRRGIMVDNHWQSDSGQVADLDQVQRSERVAIVSQEGMFASVQMQNSGFVSAHDPPVMDQHAVMTATISGPGRIVTEQMFVFNDGRTGAQGMTAPRSGFRLSRAVADAGDDPPGVRYPRPRLTITTTKTGQDVTQPLPATGGAGTATGTQDVCPSQPQGTCTPAPQPAPGKTP